jgi:hypothetical protein
MFLPELKERRGKAARASFTVAYSKVLSKGQLHTGRRAEKKSIMEWRRALEERLVL